MRQVGLGEGYSGPSVVGNLLFTMGAREGKEWVLALDWTKQGKQVWATPAGPVRHEGGGYPGPRATPEGFRLHGRFNQPDRSERNSWPHPVIAHGRLYLRDQDVLLCYEVRAGQ